MKTSSSSKKTNAHKSVAPRARKSKKPAIVNEVIDTPVFTDDEAAALITLLSSSIADDAGDNSKALPTDEAHALEPMQTQTAPDAAASIVRALKSRMVYASMMYRDAQVRTLQTELKFFDGPAFGPTLRAIEALGFDGHAFAHALSRNEGEVKSGKVHRDDFVAIYALQKIRKMMSALATGARSQIDSYSHPILVHLTEAQSVDNKTMRRTLSAGVELTELEQQIAIRRIKNCDPSTACTQASSSREMLRHMGLCNVVKGARGDTISYKVNPLAAALVALYSPALV